MGHKADELGNLLRAAVGQSGMKLLFVIKTLGRAGGSGGAERVLMQVTRALAERGHDVTVASFDAPEEQDFYRFDDGVERVRMGSGSATAPTSARQTLARLPHLRRMGREVSPDVAIGFLNSAYIPLGLALAGTGIPVVASEHIVYGHYRDRPLERWLLRLLKGRFSAITAISEEVRLSFPPAIRLHMLVVPNPVMAPPERLADPVGSERKAILSVGRFFPQKDQKTLIEAFGRVAGRFPDWRLRILGDGPLRDELQAQVTRLGLQDRVEMPGKSDDISAEYSDAQIFALSSLYESFGLATAEALVHGLPAVGFADCPGTNELIEQDVNGRLAEGGDRVAALAQELERLMASPELRTRLAANGPRSMERFGIETVADRWESVLKGVAKSA